MNEELSEEIKAKIYFLKQNINREVEVDISRYCGSSTAKDCDFKAIPGIISGINKNQTQQFDIDFKVPSTYEGRVEFYNCFNEHRWHYSHTAHAEHIQVIKRRFNEITNEEAIKVAELYHPGNDRCTIENRSNDGLVFIVNVDSSSSTDFSLDISLDFKNISKFEACSNIHRLDYGSSLTERRRLLVYQYLNQRNFLMPFLYVKEDGYIVEYQPEDQVRLSWAKSIFE